MQDGSGQVVPFYKSPIYVTALGIAVIHGYRLLATFLAKNGIATLPSLPDDAWSIGNQVLDALTAIGAYWIAHRRKQVKPGAPPPPAIESVAKTIVRLTGGTKSG